MIQDILQQPLVIRLWIFFMIGVNLGAFIFLRYTGGQWGVFLNVCNVLFVSWMYQRYGYSRILGLSHVIFWTPLVVLIFREMKLVSSGTMYGTWLRLLFFTNVISLIIDYSDVFRYFYGQGKN